MVKPLRRCRCGLATWACAWALRRFVPSCYLMQKLIFQESLSVGLREGCVQAFTGAMIQIDQSTDPTKVTVAGEAHSLRTAVDMVKVRQPPLRPAPAFVLLI